jgi:ribosome-binding factor A
MARGNRRLDQHVKEAVAQIVEEEIADPRLNLVTITDVEVTSDQKYATVYWSALDRDVVSRDPSRTGGDALPQVEEVEAGFEAARTRIQGLVARRVQSRNTPELRFRLDPVASQAARVEDLIRRVRAEEGRDDTTPGEA